MQLTSSPEQEEAKWGRFDVAVAARAQAILHSLDCCPASTTPAGGGLNLETDYQFDYLGRVTQVLGPSHTVDLGGLATIVRLLDGVPG